MKSRDVVGKRIVRIYNMRTMADPEYFGPRVVCTQIELEDRTRIVAHSSECSDCPISYMSAVKDRKGAR